MEATSIATAQERYGDLSDRVENRCMRCSRLVGVGEIRVVPPRYVQDRDPYVRAGIVRRRIMCLSCYNLFGRIRAAPSRSGRLGIRGKNRPLTIEE